MTELYFSPMKFVKKGWGHEQWIVNTEDYCGKLLFFNRGMRCSFHYHEVKRETFFLSKGKMLIKYSWDDDLAAAEETILQEGMKFEVPVGLRHQMIALEESHLYEFSTHHEDSDSKKLIKGD